MKSLEIARRLSELGELDKATDAYLLAISENDHQDPMVDFESSLYLLLTKSAVKVAYAQLVYLHKNGHYRNEIMQTLVENCYAPSLTGIAKLYQKNQNALARYKLTFCDETEFVPLDDMRIRFFSVDENGGYMPYDMETGEFLDYVNVNHQEITRNFFKDLDNPIFAKNVYSQYELEYLYDNVRKSEWCAKENHIYLYYPDFAEFCAWAQVLDFSTLLSDKKIVFLLGESQEKLYPIDFNAEYGIDYSSYSVKPFGIAEVKRLIWHTQLSSHNGGDFFNEIFDSHPNLIVQHSIMLDTISETIDAYMKNWNTNTNTKIRKSINHHRETRSNEDGAKEIGFRTAGLLLDYEKTHGKAGRREIFIGSFLASAMMIKTLDKSARIAPTLFFQPHFKTINFSMRCNKKNGQILLRSNTYNDIDEFGLLNTFKYIKTFTPIRRITTSHAATVKFALAHTPEKGLTVANNLLGNRILNQSFYIDPENQLYKDARIVRFEDGKLNPKATFTRLAAFLDLPYTNSMTYCSNGDELNPEMLPGNDRGFDPAAIYRTYDEYVDDNERYLIEYFNQPAMKTYGYDNKWYDDSEPSVEELYERITRIKGSDIVCKKQAIEESLKGLIFELTPSHDANLLIAQEMFNKVKGDNDSATCEIAEYYTAKSEFINQTGRHLMLTQMITPDPDLLEAELYR